MAVTAQTLWVCLLGYIIHTAAGALNQPREPTSKLLDKPVADRDFFYEEFSCSTNLKSWEAAVFSGKSMVCSGALVHPQWVLTVAQCWRPFYTIGLGLKRLHQTNDPGVQMVEANYSIRHPKFIVASRGNDLMLIKLSKPVVLTEGISVINIGPSCATPGTMCFASSWSPGQKGQNAADRHCVYLRVRGAYHCKPTYQKFNDNWLCATARDNNELCQIYYGGPVVCNGYLQGLVSRRYLTCVALGIPGVFTNLCVFYEWITQTIWAT